MQIGFIGLGKMGSRMVKKLLQDKHEVIVWNRSPQPAEEIKNQKSKLKDIDKKLKISKTVQELVSSLSKPKIIWSMLPAGDATEVMLEELKTLVEPNDILIDGGNAHFSDTQRRFEEFKKIGVKFLGIGVSGGIIAEKNGYPLMVGGDKSSYEYISPILESLAKPNGGYDYFGEGGAGHFVKMVHNAIEYGMMQSFGEGFGILEKAPYQLDLKKIGENWQKGSIVSSFLLDRAVDAFAKDPRLVNTAGFVEASGEAEWSIVEAKKEQVPIEIIEKSLEFRKKSKTEKNIQDSFAAKMIAALRHEFGGHEVKKNNT